MISTQGFSTHMKEPRVGADGGIIVDIQDREGNRVVKALWLQAKLEGAFPHDVTRLPRLAGQVEDMRRHTKDAYAIVYTPEGIYVRGGANLQEVLDAGSLLRETLRCERGDRNPAVVAETLDRDLVLEVLVEQTNRGR